MDQPPRQTTPNLAFLWSPSIPDQLRFFSNYISDDLKLGLDLVVVGDIAKVRMNGMETKIRWMQY